MYQKKYKKLREIPKIKKEKPKKTPEEKKKEKRQKIRDKFWTTAKPSTLKKYADAAMSNYIRERDNWTCCICWMDREYVDIDNGHYIPRQILALRFDETNCHAQCKNCNWKHNIDREPYRQFILGKYWQEKIDWFSEQSKVITKAWKIFYIEKTAYFKQKLEELKW